MKSVMQDQAKYIRIAAIIAIVGNAVLSLSKIIVGFLAKSTALIADGTDSASDVLISIITLAIVAIISRPADKEHPYGHRRAETLATVFLAFVIFFVGAQLIVNATTALINGETAQKPTLLAIIVSVVSIAGKLLLALSQFSFAKRADSAMIRANAKNMAADVVISSSVLIGLVTSLFINSSIPDKVLTILIGLWIIKTALGIFRETNLELMDGTNSTKQYAIIVEAVDSIEGASNPHRARMRRIAGFWDISFDINVSPSLSIQEAHNIASRVEDEIKSRMDNVFDIMVHVEPSGDDADEAFGLTEGDMRGLFENKDAQ